MPSAPHILLAIPCYNEALNLTALLDSIARFNHLYASTITIRPLIINDASTDNTRELLAELKNQYRFEVIEHPQNLGLRGGINSALNAFFEDRKNLSQSALGYALMDGDNSHSPFALIEMLPKLLQGFDVIVASRYRSGSKTCGVSLFRVFLSFGMAMMFKVFRNIQGVFDYSCGYRLYSPRIIRELKRRYPEDVVFEKSFACMVELLMKCHLLGAHCTEVPFLLRYDQKLGESKMPFRKTIIGTVKLFLTLRRVQ